MADLRNPEVSMDRYCAALETERDTALAQNAALREALEECADAISGIMGHDFDLVKRARALLTTAGDKP